MSRDEGFLKRWSRLKSTADAAAVAPAQDRARSDADVAPVQAGPQSAAAAAAAPAQAGAPSPDLPPVESLTADSDFSPFMQPGVEGDLRKSALKKLFDDPRFNVMDGLDVYIDDYSKPDPIPQGWLERMNQVARLGVFQPQEPEQRAEPQAPDPQAVAAPETPQLEPSSNVAERPAAASPNQDFPGSKIGEAGV